MMSTPRRSTRRSTMSEDVLAELNKLGVKGLPQTVFYDSASLSDSLSFLAALVRSVNNDSEDLLDNNDILSQLIITREANNVLEILDLDPVGPRDISSLSPIIVHKISRKWIKYLHTKNRVESLLEKEMDNEKNIDVALNVAQMDYNNACSLIGAKRAERHTAENEEIELRVQRDKLAVQMSEAQQTFEVVKKDQSTLQSVLDTKKQDVSKVEINIMEMKDSVKFLEGQVAMSPRRCRKELDVTVENLSKERIGLEEARTRSIVNKELCSVISVTEGHMQTYSVACEALRMDIQNAQSMNESMSQQHMNEKEFRQSCQQRIAELENSLATIKSEYYECESQLKLQLNNYSTITQEIRKAEHEYDMRRAKLVTENEEKKQLQDYAQGIKQSEEGQEQVHRTVIHGSIAMADALATKFREYEASLESITRNLNTALSCWYPTDNDIIPQENNQPLSQNEMPNKRGSIQNYSVTMSASSAPPSAASINSAMLGVYNKCIGQGYKFIDGEYTKAGQNWHDDYSKEEVKILRMVVEQ